MTRQASEAVASGEASFVRRYLLSTLRPHGNCLDLSALTPEEFERFRTYYSECWDPPQLPAVDLAFLDSDSAPVPLLATAIHHDITEVCGEEELLKALSSLQNRKAPGPSQVTVDFYKSIKTNSDVLSFLLSLVNQCLSGKRPKCLDACKLVLLYKKGDRTDPSNWRPVNLTNAAFRVCEAVIHARLVGWSERILSDNAFGFRKGRRAEDVSYLLANKLQRANRLRIPIHLVALDIAKAFDTAPHDQLLLSLVRAGLSMASVRVIACMLLGHTSMVGQQERSFVVHIRRGVLQGGILSPLIFNIFFDQGLSTSIPGILPLSYADDLSALCVGPTPPSEISAQARFHDLVHQKRASERRASRPPQRAALEHTSSSSSSSLDSDDGDSRSLMLPLRQRQLLVMNDSDEEVDNTALTVAGRDRTCREQVNSYLSARDSWLQSRGMHHNANKSEALILHCNSDVPVRLSADLIPIRGTVRVLGSNPSPTGFCTRPEARSAGIRAALLFKNAWLKCRHFVTLRDMRSLLMAFVYSHSVFGTCLQKFQHRSSSAPMNLCIRDALLAHPSAGIVVCYEFLGLMTPSTRAISLRLNFLLRCIDPLSPRLIREEFLQHRNTSPWFRTCIHSFTKLPQPKVGFHLVDRLHACIETLEAPAVDLSSFYSHPAPDDLNAVLVTDGSATLDEDSPVGPAGWGYLLFFRGKTYSACGHLSRSTSGNAEAMSIYHGLVHSQRLSAPFVHVRTDNSSCKELMDGNWFPDSLGCLRLYLYLRECTAQVHCYKVFSHSAAPHRDILNDAADELAAKGRLGLSECVETDTAEDHLEFLRRPIPRFNPGKEGEDPPPPPPPVSSHQTALLSLKQTVHSCIRASQMLSHLDTVRCNFRWINYPGVPPAIVGANILRQQYLYHLRYDLQDHFSRHTALRIFCSPCPFCGSQDNSNVHRIFNCNQSASVSTQDLVALARFQIALRRYRLCYTSSLPLDEHGLPYPRSDADYLFWMSSSQMLIDCADGGARPLSVTQMQLLADASFGLHRLFIKYSLIRSPASPASDVRAVIPPRRSPTLADCTLISQRLDHCRSYEEVGAWYRWHGYASSTTSSILSRSGRTGLSFMPLRSRLLKLEFILASCLCPYLESRRILVAPHCRGSSLRIDIKLWDLLREGNSMNVPVSTRDRTVVRPHTLHIDMPEYFYFLPFHYVNSSVLVEAWFAAPSLAERRNLITWPPSIDSEGLYRLSFDRLWDFYEIPERLFKRVRGGGSSTRLPRLQLHPSIQFIYDSIKQAILHDNVRVSWKARHNGDLQTANTLVAQQEIKRRLYLSLIVGDVREIRNYRPPGSVSAYTHSPAFDSIQCVPVCYQQRAVSHVFGHSLPVRGPGPHPPRSIFYDRVRSMVHAFRAAEARDSDVAPELRLRLAHTAMAESATAWARELIDGTRDPACPVGYFPPLDRPAIAAADDADDQFPIARPAAYFSEDEDDAREASPPPSDDD
jgi:ribonuclease HI